MFHSHITENLVGNNAKIAVIPGGLTSMLQPLDVSLNKSFTDCMCQQWNMWMTNGEKSFTKGGLMCAASLDVLCDFMIKLWENVKSETVIKSFKKCRISNAMDSTEDYFLWNTDDEAEIDLSMEWNPYHELINNESEDVLQEQFASDDDCEDFKLTCDYFIL